MYTRGVINYRVFSTTTRFFTTTAGVFGTTTGVFGTTARVFSATVGVLCAATGGYRPYVTTGVTIRILVVIVSMVPLVNIRIAICTYVPMLCFIALPFARRVCMPIRLVTAHKSKDADRSTSHDNGGNAPN